MSKRGHPAFRKRGTLSQADYEAEERARENAARKRFPERTEDAARRTAEWIEQLEKEAVEMTTRTVNLLRVRSGFANVPDKFFVVQPGHIPDEFKGESAETYLLPDGYTIAPARGGLLLIYDPQNRHCDIVAHSSGRPQLVTDSHNMPVLQPKAD